MHEDIFALVYYGNGFSHSDVYNMPIYLRRFYLEELLRVKDTEVKASQKQQQQPQSGNIPKFK